MQRAFLAAVSTLAAVAALAAAENDGFRPIFDGKSLDGASHEFDASGWNRNWAHPTQRRAVLNAMLWVAGAEVPAGGVESAPVSVEELNSNLDPKRNMERLELPPGA